MVFIQNAVAPFGKKLLFLFKMLDFSLHGICGSGCRCTRCARYVPERILQGLQYTFQLQRGTVIAHLPTVCTTNRQSCSEHACKAYHTLFMKPPPKQDETSTGTTHLRVERSSGADIASRRIQCAPLSSFNLSITFDNESSNRSPKPQQQ